MPSFCGSLSRAVRRHPTRRAATRRSSLHSPLAANSCRLRASSAVCRTAGLARWAFGPPGERAARTRQKNAVLLRPKGALGPAPPRRRAQLAELVLPPLAPAAKVKSVRVSGPLLTAGPRRLFREATQRKTVGAVCRVVGNESYCVETQVDAFYVVDRKGPAVSGVADVAQRT